MIQCYLEIFLKVVRVSAANISDDHRRSPVSSSGAFFQGSSLDVLRKESSNKTVTASIGVNDFFFLDREDIGLEHEVEFILLVVVFGDDDGVLSAGDDKKSV